MVDLHTQYLGIRQEVQQAIDRVLAHSAFVKGPEVAELERELAAFLGAGHCIACANGTEAITLSLMAIGLEPGDEVIVPDFSFAAPAEAVLLLGGTPVFADADPRTFNIDPEGIEPLISRRTRAVIPVHLFGQPCDMARLTEIADRHGIAVIEDNAQSLGALCRLPGGTRCAGTAGRIGCTSFFPSKVLGCYGDGGALFTDDAALARRLRALADHGQSARYDHRFVGLNSRLDTLQAAVLRVKLPHLAEWIEARRRAAAYYTAALAGVPGVETPVEAPWGTHVYHQYTIRVAPDRRDALRSALAAAGIPSMIYYPMPLSRQPAYRDRSRRPAELPCAERLSQSVLSLPMHTELTPAQQDAVIDTIRRHMNDKR